MTFSILAFVVLASGFAWHLLHPRFWVASAAAVATTAVVLQLLSLAAMGHLDPFFLYTLTINFVIGFVSAALIGCLIKFWRNLFGR